MTLPQPIDRIIKRVLESRLVVRVQFVLSTFYDADGSLVAAGLAYQALLAFVTGLLLVIGIIGYVVQDPVVRAQILEQIVGLIPPLEPIVSEALDGLAANAAALSIVGFVSLAWGASGFYDALDRSFARIFRAAPTRTMINRLGRGILSVGLLVAVVTAAAVLSAIEEWIVDALPAGPEGSGARILLSVVFPLLTVSLVLVAVASLFRVVPNTQVPLAAAGPPALLVGIALVILTQVFMFIAPRLISELSLFGTFAAVFAGLAWLSFVFQALLIGASWTRLRMDEMTEPGHAVPGGAAGS